MTDNYIYNFKNLLKITFLCLLYESIVYSCVLKKYIYYKNKFYFV